MHPVGDVGIVVISGQTTMWFDPAKNYLLTRVEDWFSTGSMEYHHVARVEQARQVDGIWLPERIVDVGVIPGAFKEGTGGVYEVRAENIRLGKVKESDLAVELPPNLTYIDDQISGQKFLVAKDGTKTLANITTGISVPERTASGLRIVIIAINVLIVVALAALLIYRRRRMAS